MGPIWGHFGRHFWGSTGSGHDFMRFASGDATANGRRPRGPVNIGSKCTCVVGVLHCIGLENRLLDPSMSSFFEAFVPSPIQTPFKTAFDADLSKLSIFGPQLGGQHGRKNTRLLDYPPPFCSLRVPRCILVPLGCHWALLGGRFGPYLALLGRHFEPQLRPTCLYLAVTLGLGERSKTAEV